MKDFFVRNRSKEKKTQYITKPIFGVLVNGSLVDECSN